MQRLFQSLIRRMNGTTGFHYMQKMEGCSIYDNGTVSIVFDYHYDGKPFLIFRPDKVMWSAEVPEAQGYADNLNQNQTELDQHLDILVNSCIPHIPHLLSLGSCTFNRTEQPIVRVTRTAIINSTCTLRCRAYGHYPKDISMAWYRNGQPMPEALMERVTLPLPDITYLTSLSLEVTLNNSDVYRCSVAHSSMRAPLHEELKLSEESGEQSGLSVGGIIAVCLGVMLLVVLIVFGSVSVGKCRRHERLP